MSAGTGNRFVDLKLYEKIKVRREGRTVEQGLMLSDAQFCQILFDGRQAANHSGLVSREDMSSKLSV